nr:hypothetical protein CFP56_25826 [Quercus suber]
MLFHPFPHPPSRPQKSANRHYSCDVDIPAGSACRLEALVYLLRTDGLQAFFSDLSSRGRYGLAASFLWAFLYSGASRIIAESHHCGKRLRKGMMRDIIKNYGINDHVQTSSRLDGARGDRGVRSVVEGGAGTDAEDGAVDAADGAVALQLVGDAGQDLDERAEQGGGQAGDDGQFDEGDAGGEADRVLRRLRRRVRAVAERRGVQLLVAVHRARVAADAADAGDGLSDVQDVR